jgi:parvulin-like peptidyl-prolyl isomerase
VLAEAKRLGSSSPGFGDLARENSEDQTSRYRGGDMGWVGLSEAEGRWGKEIADALFGLKSAGEFTGVLKSADGLHLFRLMEKQPARTKPLKEVEELVAYRVQRQKNAATEKAFEEKIRSGLPIEVNQGLADQIIKAAPPLEQSPPSMPGR